MTVTPEFERAVRDKNLLRIRIMLKDSLLVDKSFRQFTEMSQYAEGYGANFWMPKTEEIEIASRDIWNVELMNLELTRLVSDFTMKRLAYCQAIIKKVYGTGANPVQKNNVQSSTAKDVAYDAILKGVSQMNQILYVNKTDKGRAWLYSDIKKIQDAAQSINRACENIRKGENNNGAY